MRKILLIEDDPHLLRAIEIYLIGLGFEVQSCLDTTSVVSLFDEFKPDLGVFDVWVDPVAGDELCQIVKTEVRAPDFPVILISAKNDLQKRAIKAQADCFLKKPFRLPKLGDLIINLLN